MNGKYEISLNVITRECSRSTLTGTPPPHTHTHTAKVTVAASKKNDFVFKVGNFESIKQREERVIV
jgi:hypothetical protein